MPRTCIDTADPVELAETLQLIAGWLAADPAPLGESFLAYRPGTRCDSGNGSNWR
jgi:hypothetical protein